MRHATGHRGNGGAVARVIVIGAGVGGLACAARLAAAGHTVEVHERAATVGGKLGTATIDGYTFDTGPSLLTMPWVFEDLFAATGDGLREVLAVRRLEEIARYRFADGTRLRAHADDAAFTAELDAVLGPGAGASWGRLMERAGRMWRATEGPFLSQPLAGASTLLRLAARSPRDIAVIAPTRTLRQLGSTMLRGPGAAELRMMLDRYATYTGSDPRRAPAALAVIPYAERAFGGWYIDGGLRALADALADRAREHGAEIVTGSEVTAIRLRGGRTVGVTLGDGTPRPADAVVANADAGTVWRDLLPARGSPPRSRRRGWTAPRRDPDRDPVARAGRRARRRLARCEPSLAGFVLLLALEPGAPRPGAQHTVLFPADYDAEFDAVFGGRMPADPTVYISAPADPALAPPGGQAWFVLVNAPRHVPAGGLRALAGGPAVSPAVIPAGMPAGMPAGGGDRRPGVDWDMPGRASAYADHVLDLMASRGLDVRCHLRHRRILTPADTERATATPGGAIYGTSSNGPAAAFLRPANATGVGGLFLVGGSSHPGGGLPLVTLSAKIVTGLVQDWLAGR